MPILHIGSEAEGNQLRRRRGYDGMSELLDELEDLLDADGRHLELVHEAISWAEFVINPDRAGHWVVKGEAEQRWLISGLSAISAALGAHARLLDVVPNLEMWLRYFQRDPVVTVDTAVAATDLCDYEHWITGQCRICRKWTTGLSEEAIEDGLTVDDIERYEAEAAAGDWICSECHSNLCDDCGERLRAPGDDELCAECRADEEAEAEATGQAPGP